jgi:energy-coupling factor transporter ATP-binding protein EcfA2
MELNGKVDFPEGKTVVIYGANLQGKTNVINVIRYAFLKESKKGRKSYYDEWALPTREEVTPLNGSGEIRIVFEHEGKYYMLERIIARNKADRPNLVQLSGWPGSVVKTIDPENFLKERLKVGLLDILFAPEISGGFKRLYGREIEDAIGEVFKEVISARRLAQSFSKRLERLKSGAEAKMASIKSEYDKLVKSLVNVCKDIGSFSSFEALKSYDVGKSYGKMEKLEEEIRGRIQTLSEAKMFSVIQDASNNAKTFDELMKMLSNIEEIKNCFKEMKKARVDKGRLQKFIRGVQGIESPEGALAKAPRFYDEQLQSLVNSVLKRLEESRRNMLEARRGAGKLGVKLENVDDVLKDVESVIAVLKTRKEIKEEEKAALTKIAGRVHAVIPINVLTRDPVYTKIASEPIPKCSEKERKRHLDELQLRKTMLLEILEKVRKSDGFFNHVKKKDLQTLLSYHDGLENRIRKLEGKIDKWLTELTSNISVFMERKQKKPRIGSQKGLQAFVTRVVKAVESKREEYLYKLNRILQPLGIRVEEFSKREIGNILKELEKQKSNIPSYNEAIKLLNSQKEVWRSKDEEHMDYSVVPKLVEDCEEVINSIINNSVDEERLREAVASTYTDIINKMKERKLIQAVASISKEAMKAEVTYKDKPITHPAGAEKAFFSLAILTALGYYFRMPVLIDEVANNLDSKNLQAFFNLVTELKDERSVQYLLSVKETKDFDMEGWVKDIADDLVIYRIEDKNIMEIWQYTSPSLPRP